MGKISFAEDAWADYLYWQTQDKKTLKKKNNLIKYAVKPLALAMGI